MAGASPSPSTSSTNDASTFKVVLCGEKGVGKTALFNRYKDDKFYDRDSHSVYADQCLISVPYGNNEVKINLWDTAGMEEFNSLTRSYFHKSVFVIIVYSTDIKSSIKVASDYAHLAGEHAGGAKIILVQNKIDLPDKFPTSGSDVSITDLKSEFKFKFEFKMSAKTGQGTKEMLKKLVKHYMERVKPRNKGPAGIRVGGRGNARQKLGKCCSRR